MSMELQLQSNLVNAVVGQANTVEGIQADTLALGLAAYRNSGKLNAARAMSLLFTGVFALLGEDDFNPLAALHWRAYPPEQGDWSQYGEHFADWIHAQNPGDVLTSLPFLPDLARLDLAMARCQDSANSPTDLATLALLEQDANSVNIQLDPSVSVLTLHYDLIDFRQAVIQHNTLSAPAPTEQNVLICRDGWRAKAVSIDAASAHFVSQCLQQQTLLQAHTAACETNPSFDFSQWLTAAIQFKWISRVNQTNTESQPPIQLSTIQSQR